jgi:hypothetical protein
MKISQFTLILFLIGFISATPICIDKINPDSPATLTAILSNNDLTISWGEVVDEPDCSGIEKYVLLRNGKEIYSGSDLSYTDSDLSSGIYLYSVYTIDLAGHSSYSINKQITISSSTNEDEDSNSESTSSSSSKSRQNNSPLNISSGDSYICEENWVCENWGECNSEGFQIRNCIDQNSCVTSLNQPKEIQECEKTISEETPETFMSAMTGFVTGAATGVGEFAKTPIGIATLVFGVLILVAGAWIIFFKKN